MNLQHTLNYLKTLDLPEEKKLDVLLRRHPDVVETIKRLIKENAEMEEEIAKHDY